MSRQNAPLYSFNQGEVSRRALGRVDVAKLRLAAACQVNWLPWTLGPMQLRPGLIRIGEVLNDAAAKLVRFVFSKLDVALIECTDHTLRIWVSEQLVTRVAVATLISDPNFATGTGWTNAGSTDGATATANTGVGLLGPVPTGGLARLQQTVTVVLADRGKEHGLRLTVTTGPVTLRIGSSAGLSDLLAQTALDAGTHSLAFTPAGASFVLQLESTDARQKTLGAVLIDTAGALTLPTPWGASDLPDLRYDQSGDIIYVACDGVQQRKIERRGVTSWSVVLYTSADGPFQSAPGADANFTIADAAANTQISSDRPYFQPGHVECLFRLFISGQQFVTQLGASNSFTPPVRISGVGTASRNFNWAVSGTYVGALTWLRSFDGPDSGFAAVSNGGSGATGNVFSSSTGGSGGTPPLDNIVCWEKVGFLAGNYASGLANVQGLYNGDGAFTTARVTAYVSPTVVQVEMLSPTPNVLATKDWVEQDWSGVRGYPSAVTFFDGRLFWLGRDQFWGSVSNDYISYADIDSSGNALGDSGALNEQFGSGPVDVVCFGLGLTRLLAGREGSVASIRASAFDEVLTPTNISSKDCTTQGAARLPAVKVDMTGIYVQQSGRRVYKLVFNPQKLDYVALDVTRLNVDVGKAGFVDLDVQRQPDTNVHLVRGDGQSAVLLDDDQDDIECWTRLMTLGVIENTCVLPDAGIEDLVYFVVRRTIGGVTKRFIERMAHRDSAIGGALNVMADCCLSYSGAPVSFVTAAWLPSMPVVVWADGVDLGPQVTDQFGNFAFPGGKTYSNVVMGLGGAMITGSTTARFSDNTAPDQVFDDPTNALTVGSAYEGYPAEVFADVGGAGRLVHIGSVVVASGAIALPDGRIASTIVAFLGYIAPFMSAKLAYAAQMGSALTQKKQIDHVGLLLQDAHAQGLRFGQSFTSLESMPGVEESAPVDANTVWLEYDEAPIQVSGTWDTDARLCMVAQAPRPCTVAGAVVSVTTNEK